MRSKAASLFLLASTASLTAQSIPCWETNLGTNLGITDETVSAAQPLGFTFTYGGVSYTDIQVCDNGYITLGASGGQPDYNPSSTTLLTDLFPRICPFWVDLEPFNSGTNTGGGAVYFNALPASGSLPARAVITWDAVFEYFGNTPHTFQLTLIDGGSVQVGYGADLAQNGYPWLVGCSPGNNATANPVTFTTLPIQTLGNATMHEEDPNGSGSPLAGDTLQWLPDGTGGWIVIASSGCADSNVYGTGCVASYTSFYEHFVTTPSIDLSNTAFQLNFNGSSYFVLNSTTTTPYLAPSAAAVSLGLTDDSETTITLAGPLAFPGGSTSTLNVCSNGRVEVASNGAAFDYTPTPAELLNWPNATWSVWRDFIPNATGNVWFEEVGSLSIVTWLNVVGYVGQNTGTTPSTFQLQFDRSNGNVAYVFQSMDTVSVSTWAGGEGWIVGFTVGGASADPGSVDITAKLATGVITTSASDNLPLSIEANGSPIVNTQIGLDIDGITPTAQFGGLLLGFVKYPNGISLTPFGMPGCFQFNDALAVVLFFPNGQTNVTLPFNVPNYPGIRMQAQAAAYDPAAAQTPLGATSSNGLELGFGN